jgi:uncharacterized OB-fold protein
MNNHPTNQTGPIAATLRQKIEIPYSYVAGRAVTRFLLGLKEKVFIASVCGSCGRKNVLPLSFCGRCWKPIDQFVPVGPLGTLESFAAVPGGVPELPHVVGPVIYGLVRLDGADTLLAHVITGDAEDKIRCGARVEAVWCEERSGSILDVAAFRVLREG